MSFPPYESYKDSGVEWLEQVPEHWHMTRLRFVATFNPSKQEVSDLPKDEEVSFLPMEAIGEDGSLNLEKSKPISEVENGYTFFRDGDIAIAKITPCFENGKGALMKGLKMGIGFGTTELTILRPQTGIIAEFLHYLASSQVMRKLGEAQMYGAGGQKRVPDDFYRDFKIGLPLPPEQRAIVTFLDQETARIDTLIAKQKRLIELSLERQQAFINHAVTRGADADTPLRDSGIEWLGQVPEHWKNPRKMKEISSLKGRLGWQGLKADEYKDEGPYVVSSAHFNKFRIDWGICPHVANERYELDSNIQLAEGDILLMKDGAALGKLAFVDSLPNLACLNSHLLLFRPLQTSEGNTYNPQFMFFFMRTAHFQEYIKIHATGTTFLGISQEAIGNYRVALPSLQEQNDIVAFLDEELGKIDTLIAKAQRSIELMREHRTSLIAAAVTGKIDVRGVVPVEDAL